MEERGRRPPLDSPADDDSSFPNFAALSPEERVALFQTLTAARKSLEGAGPPSRMRFGTVHDAYLEHFQAREESDRLPEPSPEKPPRLDDLTSEEKRVFFSVLKEARDKLMEETTDVRNLETILENYQEGEEDTLTIDLNMKDDPEKKEEPEGSRVKQPDAKVGGSPQSKVRRKEPQPSRFEQKTEKKVQTPANRRTEVRQRRDNSPGSFISSRGIAGRSKTIQEDKRQAVESKSEKPWRKKKEEEKEQPLKREKTRQITEIRSKKRTEVLEKKNGRERNENKKPEEDRNERRERTKLKPRIRSKTEREMKAKEEQKGKENTGEEKKVEKKVEEQNEKEALKVEEVKGKEGKPEEMNKGEEAKIEEKEEDNIRTENEEEKEAERKGTKIEKKEEEKETQIHLIEEEKEEKERKESVTMEERKQEDEPERKSPKGEGEGWIRETDDGGRKSDDEKEEDRKDEKKTTRKVKFQNDLYVEVFIYEEVVSDAANSEKIENEWVGSGEGVRKEQDKREVEEDKVEGADKEVGETEELVKDEELKEEELEKEVKTVEEEAKEEQLLETQEKEVKEMKDEAEEQLEEQEQEKEEERLEMENELKEGEDKEKEQKEVETEEKADELGEREENRLKETVVVIEGESKEEVKENGKEAETEKERIRKIEVEEEGELIEEERRRKHRREREEGEEENGREERRRKRMRRKKESGADAPRELSWEITFPEGMTNEQERVERFISELNSNALACLLRQRKKKPGERHSRLRPPPATPAVFPPQAFLQPQNINSGGIRRTIFYDKGQQTDPPAIGDAENRVGSTWKTEPVLEPPEEKPPLQDIIKDDSQLVSEVEALPVNQGGLGVIPENVDEALEKSGAAKFIQVLTSCCRCRKQDK